MTKDRQELLKFWVAPLVVTLVGTFVGVFAAATLSKLHQRDNDIETLRALIDQAQDQMRFLECEAINFVKGRTFKINGELADKRYNVVDKDLTDTSIPAALARLMDNDLYPRYLLGKTVDMQFHVNNMNRVGRSFEYRKQDRLDELKMFAGNLKAARELLDLQEGYLLGRVSESEYKTRSSYVELSKMAREETNEFLKSGSSRRCDPRG